MRFSTDDEIQSVAVSPDPRDPALPAELALFAWQRKPATARDSSSLGGLGKSPQGLFAHVCMLSVGPAALVLLPVGLLFCSSAVLSGCTREPATQPFSREQLFRLHCSGCHGDGTGNGHIAKTLKKPPRNLRHHEWQSSVTDEHILQVIRDGGIAVELSKEMPAFAEKLTQREMESLVGYIRHLGR